MEGERKRSEEDEGGGEGSQNAGALRRMEAE